MSAPRRTIATRTYGANRMRIVVPDWFGTTPDPILQLVESSLHRLGDRQTVRACQEVACEIRHRAIWCMHSSKVRCSECYLPHFARQELYCAVCAATPATALGGLALELMDGSLDLRTRTCREAFTGVLELGCIALCDRCRNADPKTLTLVP